MRTIKFRGKRVDNGEWVHGFYYELWNPIQGNRIPVIDESKKFDHDGDSITVYEVIPETVGQFTGLLDKNGKEIYEGDVINSDTRTHSGKIIRWTIAFRNGSFMIKSGRHTPHRPSNYFWKGIYAYSNIHDNPELIK